MKKILISKTRKEMITKVINVCSKSIANLSSNFNLANKYSRIEKFEDDKDSARDIRNKISSLNLTSTFCKNSDKNKDDKQNNETVKEDKNNNDNGEKKNNDDKDNKNDDNKNNSNKDDDKKNNGKPFDSKYPLAIFFFIMGVQSLALDFASNYLNSELDNIEFLDKIKDGEIKKIEIFKASNDSPFFLVKSDIFVALKSRAKIYETTVSNVQNFINAVNNLETSLHREEKDKVIINNKETFIYINVGRYSAMFLFAIAFFLSRKTKTKINTNTFKFDSSNKNGSIFDSFNTKDNIQDFSKDEKPKVKFNEVAGMNSAKREITEFVDFLKNSEKYTKLGAKIPKGALLVGPPGTGKTLLAKATAGEAGVPFYSMSGSEFIEMFVGVGAGRVRKLFKKARENSPSIIFIDEIDAIGKSRKSSFQNDESDSTLNQLLVEMDGFGTEQNVIVLAATNFAESLDPALTRPGRFDRKVEVLLPDINEREEILKIYLNKIVLSKERTIDDYAKRLATLTPGFSGADLANVVNEAAIITARNNLDSVNSEAFEKANERVIAGMETKRPMDEKTKKTIAIHESGHAICSWLLENASPLVKITIIPRSKGALGFNQFISDDRNLYSKEYILDQICTLLGGRIAEKEIIGKITTGASDDLKKITNLAYTMVTKLGMSDLGLQAFSDNNYVKPFSAEYEKVINFKLRKLMKK